MMASEMSSEMKKGFSIIERNFSFILWVWLIWLTQMYEKGWFLVSNYFLNLT